MRALSLSAPPALPLQFCASVRRGRGCARAAPLLVSTPQLLLLSQPGSKTAEPCCCCSSFSWDLMVCTHGCTQVSPDACSPPDPSEGTLFVEGCTLWYRIQAQTLPRPLPLPTYFFLVLCFRVCGRRQRARQPPDRKSFRVSAMVSLSVK